MIGMKKNSVTSDDKGQFLCYTEDMESGINQVSVAKTIHIPPKHNGAISVSIKGHDIKTPTACFIGSQYTAGVDPGGAPGAWAPPDHQK